MVEVDQPQLLTANMMVGWVVVDITTLEEEELLYSSLVLELNTITVQQVVLEQQDLGVALWMDMVKEPAVELVEQDCLELVGVVARLVGTQVMTVLDHVPVIRVPDKEVLYGILIYYFSVVPAAALVRLADLVVHA